MWQSIYITNSVPEAMVIILKEIIQLEEFCA